MRDIRFVLASVLSLAACTNNVLADSDEGPEPMEPEQSEPPVPFAGSGDRLEHRGWLVSGMGVHVETWDTELGVACAFVRAEDGELRCVPAASSEFGITPIFTDAGCSETGALYFGDDPSLATCGGPVAVGHSSDAATGCDEAVWAADALTETEPPAAVYWPEPDGGCTLAPTVPIGSYYAPTPIDPSGLVRGERIEELDEEGLGYAVIVADDGSSLVVGPADQRFDGVRVEELEQPPGTWLVPEVVARPSILTECAAEPVYAVAECGFDRLGAVIDEEGQVFEPGPVVAFEDIDVSGCGDFVPDELPGIVHVRRGEALGADALTRLVLEEVEPTEGESVSARVLSTETGERLLPHESPLAVDGSICTAVLTSDGGVCISQQITVGDSVPAYFADASCTTPVLVDHGENETLGSGDLITQPDSSCGLNQAVFAVIWRVAGSHAGPVFNQGDSGCVEAMTTGSWLAVEPVDLASFASLDYGRL